MFNFRDDSDLTKTTELTHTVSTLRRFRDGISRTIKELETFENIHVAAFDTTGSDAFRQSWQEYIADIRQSTAEMKSMQILLAQKLELFNTIRDGVCGGPFPQHDVNLN